MKILTDLVKEILINIGDGNANVLNTSFGALNVQFYSGTNALFSTGLQIYSTGYTGSNAFTQFATDATYATATFGTFLTAAVSTAGNVGTFAFLNSFLIELVTGNVSTTGGTGDLKFNTTAWGVGDIVSITALSFRMPG